MTARRPWVDWLLLWVALAGLYPLADPGHHGDSPLVALDLSLHVTAFAVLLTRWKVARR